MKQYFSVRTYLFNKTGGRNSSLVCDDVALKDVSKPVALPQIHSPPPVAPSFTLAMLPGRYLVGLEGWEENLETARVPEPCQQSPAV